MDTIKCKQCLEYFETDIFDAAFCSTRCKEEYENACEDEDLGCDYEGCQGEMCDEEYH